MEKKKVLAYALANALDHDGKAQVGAVLSKLFHEGLKKEDVKKVIPDIKKIVREVNALSKEQQEQKFSELNKLVKKRKVHEGLHELPGVGKGKVVMRFAPFPSGPLHIGNARPAILNDEYCKMYKGKLILVIDDTIGSEEKKIIEEAYKLIPEGLDWLGVKYKKPVVFKSKRLKNYYKYAEELIRKGKAYVCFCSADVLHKNRIKGVECKCRGASVDENLKHWKEMLKGKYKEGKSTLRIKTSMQDKNPAFRDRVLFKITDREHPKLKTKAKARVWPLLDFSWAIDDHLLGVTHILRGKDLMIETDMEKFIFDIFNWKHPVFIHHGLLRFEEKLSTSKSQKEVLGGKYIGWDDPRTWSLQSLERRGFSPEAIRKFIIDLGLTQTEVHAPIDNLYKENKKYVEKSNRYFFISDPVKIKIKSAPRLKARAPLHPDHKNRGYRSFTTEQEFYLERQDLEGIRKGKVYRLMHLLNFIKNTYYKFVSTKHDPKLGAKLIHWLPVNPRQVMKCEVLMPDGKGVEGLVERDVMSLKVGEVCQFERFGFCRLDKKEKGKVVFWFSHK